MRRFLYALWNWRLLTSLTERAQEHALDMGWKALELQAEQARQRAALHDIDQYGHRNPGMGWNCAEKAKAALAGLSESSRLTPLAQRVVRSNAELEAQQEALMSWPDGRKRGSRPHHQWDLQTDCCLKCLMPRYALAEFPEQMYGCSGRPQPGRSERIRPRARA